MTTTYTLKPAECFVCAQDVAITEWVRINWRRCAVARAIAEHAVGAALAKVGRL